MIKNSSFRKVASRAAIVVLGIAGVLTTARLIHADDDGHSRQDDNSNSKIQIGAQIAPVKLTISHGDKEQVYLGSYIVNAVGGCNDCHTNPSYAPNGNPYMGQPKAINAAKYLAGGATFGPFTSRNITPDSTGKPAGLTYPEFVQVIRHGTDFDHVHGPNVPLQVMPWPVYQSMTDGDLRAIYAYLSAIPCLEGDPGVNPSAPPPFRCK